MSAHSVVMLCIVQPNTKNEVLYSIYSIGDRFLKRTSLAIVVMNAAGRAVAISVKACREVRQESAAGLKGRP